MKNYQSLWGFSSFSYETLWELLSYVDRILRRVKEHVWISDNIMASPYKGPSIWMKNFSNNAQMKKAVRPKSWRSCLYISHLLCQIKYLMVRQWKRETKKSITGHGPIRTRRNVNTGTRILCAKNYVLAFIRFDFYFANETLIFASPCNILYSVQLLGWL